MKIQNLTFRTQIFLALMLLLVFPLIILGVSTANRTVRQVNDQYLDTLDTITRQTNLNLETLLADAEKIGNLHLINDDILKIMKRDYGNDSIRFAQDSFFMRTQIGQANRLNSSVVSCIFQNKFGFTFDYNINTHRDLVETLDKMAIWAKIARNSDHNSYVGPIQHPLYSATIYKNVLPMVKILRDANTSTEIGVFYISINFNAIANILQSSKLPNSIMLFLNDRGERIFTSDEGFVQNADNRELLSQLQQLGGQTDELTPIRHENIRANRMDYTVTTVFNRTTGWKIIHFIDNTVMKSAYRSIFRTYSAIVFLSLLLGLLLAYFLSSGLTKSIGQLCRKIDAYEDGNSTPITLEGTLLNSDLQKVVNSYNNLNLRLADSIRQNLNIRFNEKLLKFKILQAQVNPHFLYNTLNLISSLANIHDVPEIRTITNSLSDLLRHNLKSGPIIPLRLEYEQAAKYVAIQQIRFPGKFTFSASIPEEYLDIDIPVFLLQPLVENAIVHGFEETATGGTISINAYARTDVLHILVADNGAGIVPEIQDAIRSSFLSDTVLQIDHDAGSSIGLVNVHQRIQAYYGKEFGLTVDSAPSQGTIVDLSLPLHVKPKLPYESVAP